MTSELGQKAVDFSFLVRKAAEDSYLSFKELVEKFSQSEEEEKESSDAEKKIALLKFVAKTRQRMLRLHVLAKWCQQIPLVHYCQQLASTLSSHDTCFTQTADSLFFMHDGLQQVRAPIFDVPSAVEVLLSGGYKRLPKCIENIGIESTLPSDQLEPALKKLNTLLRSRLLETSIPKEISEVKVLGGSVILRVKGEFEVYLTLGYHGHLSMWRILHLKLLIGEKNRVVKLEEKQRYALADDLERRMALAEKPFMILYTVLHELCVSLIMDTVLRQVQVLRQGRWKDAICFELISDVSIGQRGNAGTVQLAQDAEFDSSGLKTPGLKIIYWLDFEKNISEPASTSSPFIKIEPGPDLQVRCLHSSFVLDPLTDKVAEFSLDQSCIDVEKIILRAIACNKHTRLLEIQRQLTRNVQICQASSDVILKRAGDEADTDEKKGCAIAAINEDFGDEVLRVRAYNISYITLAISIRNGRFLLRTTESIIATTTLLECEEALNLGSMTAAEVFITLRTKSILHLFALIGRSLGLKVYEQCLSTLEIPKFMLHGSDLLLMEFPQCGSSYYLLMQLDRDFKLLFSLLEIQSEERSHLVSDANHILHSHKIDINQIYLDEDESNLTLNWEKVNTLRKEETSNPISEDNLLSDSGLQSTIQLPGSGKYSSFVDEVFVLLKKGGSAPSFPVQSLSSSPINVSTFSHLSSLSMTHQGIKPGDSMPNLDGAMLQSQMSNVQKLSGASSSSSSQFVANNSKGLLHSIPLSSPSPSRNSYNQRLPVSNSDHDLSSFKFPHLNEVGKYSAMDEEQSRLANKPSRGILAGGNRPNQLSTPLQTGLTTDFGFLRTIVPDDVSRPERTSLKRPLSKMLIPSMEESEDGIGPRKIRKILESVRHPIAPQAPLSLVTKKRGGYAYGTLISDANHGFIPSNVYISVLHHVVRHCSICIKHARLTSQMDALEIPYAEEVGRGTHLWLRLPFAREDSWEHICLWLGKPGSMYWDVKIYDPHFQELWELCRGSTSTQWGCDIRIANTSDVDSHIQHDSEGVVLNYRTVETDSMQKLVSDIQRLSNAQLFACGMRKLIGIRVDDKLDDSNKKSENKLQLSGTCINDAGNKLSEQMTKTFKIEAVGLMCLWFSYGSMPVMSHFVVEWEAGKEGCTMHVSPDHLWPHTKFLEDFINGGEVASFLDCIRLTAGPLLALAAAIPPARMPGPVSAGPSIPKQNNSIPSVGQLLNAPSSNAIQCASSVPADAADIPSTGSHSLHSAATLSAVIRGGSGTVPSSLLPIDVSIVLRGPYWIRIIYRKKFSVDMRCFAGDQVWLQPATPPKGGPAAGGSLPCPQFRPFIMEHVAQGLNSLEPNFSGGAPGGGHMNSTNNTNHGSGTQPLVANGNRQNMASSGGMARPNSTGGSQGAGSMTRISNAILSSSGMPAGVSGVPVRISPVASVPVHVRGELNTAFIGLGDDGGYGGGWVPLAALKKVLRGILKYLGVLWLFAQLPDLLKEILGSILKENEGTLLNLDQEQPALRFFVGSYVFAVSVHRVQLLLQVLSVKRFHPQQQQQHAQGSTQDELSTAEINEISDYFSRRVASEPYDASRVASFITLLTLPISVLREFLKLIAWKKGLSQALVGDLASAQRARIELCLENHSGSGSDENSESSVASRSNIFHDRAHNSVNFALTFVLDAVHLPHINAAGGAAWLPYCVSVRLKYHFGESPRMSFLEMNGSHGGRACWSLVEDWEKCKQRLGRTVEYANGNSVGDLSQGRLRLVAESLKRALRVSLQQLRESQLPSSSTGT